MIVEELAEFYFLAVVRLSGMCHADFIFVNFPSINSDERGKAKRQESKF